MSHWSKIEESGFILGMEFLLKVHLWFGRRILQIFLYPVVSYYWIINKEGRKASRDYLLKIANYSSDQSINGGLLCSYKHFIVFANALIDKVAVWSGDFRLNDLEYHGREAIINHCNENQGLLLLGSHLGNLDVCRAIAAVRKNIVINVLLHTQHSEKFNALLNKYAESTRIELIEVSTISPETVMRLQDKIEAGELVIIAADRTPVSGEYRVTRVEFFGQLASFPQGPFILASLLKCPVYTVFCLRKKNKHVIYFDHFSNQLFFSRKNRTEEIQKSVQVYAGRLQQYCIEEPLQWFNFYDFWRT